MIEATYTESRNNFDDETLESLLFMANPEVTDSNDDDDLDFDLSQQDVEQFLVLMIDGLKLTGRNSSKKELRRGDRVAVKYFSDGKPYMSIATLTKRCRDTQGAWMVTWESDTSNPKQEHVWDPTIDFEWLPVS
jgi:hypothetical protein